jgi:ribosomal protein S18 acetylase RimI-like enzyme
MTTEDHFITLTTENLDREHICCAFAGSKAASGVSGKKDWIRSQLDQGFVFRKLDARAKVFIEYVSSENAWAPLEAPGYLAISCFWVSGHYKGHGYGKQLLESCEADAENGVVVVSSAKKRPFMAAKKFFEKYGYGACDTAPPYFELMVTRTNPDAPLPRFAGSAHKPVCEDNGGIVVFFTPQCPYNDYYVNVAEAEVAGRRGIPFEAHPVTTREEARKAPTAFPLHSVFYRGNLLTHEFLYDDRSFDRAMKTVHGK